MKIINPSVKIWRHINSAQHIARCARVCYGKDSTIGMEKADKALLELLEQKGHLSMFRHTTRYFKVPHFERLDLYNKLKNLDVDRISNFIGIDIFTTIDNAYVVANGQYMLEHDGESWLEQLIHFEVSEYDFVDNDIPETVQMLRYTFKVTTQIATSRELNRVSPNNIAEKSTRYVYEDGTLCAPWFMMENGYKDEQETIYLQSCNKSFECYKMAVDAGMKREDARGMLPLDTATECVYTYSVDEWKHIIDLRYYGKTGVPHPNAKIIAGMIREQLNYELKKHEMKL